MILSRSKPDESSSIPETTTTVSKIIPMSYLNALKGSVMNCSPSNFPNRAQELWNKARIAIWSIDFIDYNSRKVEVSTRTSRNGQLVHDNNVDDILGYSIYSYICENKSEMISTKAKIFTKLYAIKSYWDIMISFILLYDLISLPYRLAFKMNLLHDIIIETIIDFILIIDSLYDIRFDINRVLTKEEALATTLNDQFTLRNRIRLFIQFLGCIPYQLFYMELLRIKIIRIIYIIRINKIFQKLFERIFVNNARYSNILYAISIVFRTLMIFLYITNLISCYMIDLAHMIDQPNDTIYTWYELFYQGFVNKVSSSPLDIDYWIESMYITAQTFSTVGYGNDIGHALAEILARMGMVLIGNVLYVMLNSSIKYAMMQSETAHKLTKYNFDNIKLWLMNINQANSMALPLKEETWIYTKDILLQNLKTHSKEIFRKNMFFSKIRPNYQIDIVNRAYYTFIKSFEYLLKDVSPAFKKELLIYLDSRYIRQNQLILRKGHESNFIYFIMENGIDVLDMNDMKIGAMICGHIIGEQIMFYEVQSEYTYKVGPDHPVFCLELHYKKYLKLKEQFIKDINIMRVNLIRKTENEGLFLENMNKRRRNERRKSIFYSGATNPLTKSLIERRRTTIFNSLTINNNSRSSSIKDSDHHSLDIIPFQKKKSWTPMNTFTLDNSNDILAINKKLTYNGLEIDQGISEDDNESNNSSDSSSNSSNSGSDSVSESTKKEEKANGTSNSSISNNKNENLHDIQIFNLDLEANNISISNKEQSRDNLYRKGTSETKVTKKSALVNSTKGEELEDNPSKGKKIKKAKVNKKSTQSIGNNPTKQHSKQHSLNLESNTNNNSNNTTIKTIIGSTQTKGNEYNGISEFKDYFREAYENQASFDENSFDNPIKSIDESSKRVVAIVGVKKRNPSLSVDANSSCIGDRRNNISLIPNKLSNGGIGIEESSCSPMGYNALDYDKSVSSTPCNEYGLDDTLLAFNKFCKRDSIVSEELGSPFKNEKSSYLFKDLNSISQIDNSPTCIYPDIDQHIKANTSKNTTINLIGANHYDYDIADDNDILDDNTNEHRFYNENQLDLSMDLDIGGMDIYHEYSNSIEEDIVYIEAKLSFLKKQLGYIKRNQMKILKDLELFIQIIKRKYKTFIKTNNIWNNLARSITRMSSLSHRDRNAP